MSTISSLPKWLTEGLILAAIPLLGYAYAFAYELGYLQRFGVPYYFISVSLRHTLLAAGVLLLAWMVVGFGLDMLPAGPWWGLLWHLWSLGLTVLALRLVTWHADWTRPSHVFLMVTFGGTLLLILLAEIMQRIIMPIVRYDGTWLERWARSAASDIHKPRKDAHAAAVEALDRAGINASAWMFPLWFIGIVLPLLFYGAGKFVAARQSVYLVVEHTPPCVLLREYDGRLLCAETNTAVTRLTGRVTFLNNEPITYRPRRLTLRDAARAEPVQVLPSAP